MEVINLEDKFKEKGLKGQLAKNKEDEIIGMIQYIYTS